MTQLFRFAFTWHANILERERLHEALRDLCPKFIYQYEKGEQNGREHFQGRLTLHKKLRLKNLAELLHKQYKLEGLHLSPEKDEGGSTLYGSKSATRLQGPWCFPEEALPYNGEDLPTEDLLYPWQQALVRYCRAPVLNNREIVWCCDGIGASGKSTLAKFLHFHLRASCHSWSDTKHTLQAVVSEGAKKVYVFDLTRTKPTEVGNGDLYSALESIKNGHVRSPMYDARTLVFPPPHVIVFANHPPADATLSPDRITLVSVPPRPPSAAPPLPRFSWLAFAAPPAAAAAGPSPDAAASDAVAHFFADESAEL